MHCAGQHGCGHSPHHTRGDIGHHPADYCCGTGHGFRRFHTREEMITRLEGYLKNLQAEAKGVEERITELKKEKK